MTEWNRVELLKEWRQHWADLANEHLPELAMTCASITAVIATRAWCWSRPSHLGKAVDEMRARGEYAQRARRLDEVRDATRSGSKQQPEIVFDN